MISSFKPIIDKFLSREGLHAYCVYDYEFPDGKWLVCFDIIDWEGKEELTITFDRYKQSVSEFKYQDISDWKERGQNPYKAEKIDVNDISITLFGKGVELTPDGLTGFLSVFEAFIDAANIEVFETNAYDAGRDEFEFQIIDLDKNEVLSFSMVPHQAKENPGGITWYEVDSIKDVIHYKSGRGAFTECFSEKYRIVPKALRDEIIGI